ncbi:serine protease [Allorhizocola rhizosphaerae]|uniref:serine protease n=1 Tax=Allorhizocola rhizosphaerae TaxID=1872709 RepID=UPI000E3C3FE4|nr:serine protease [Allorhizocola rhizosphaerae]
MDPGNLADIRSGDDDGSAVEASGYRIGPTLVLTAKHAVVDGDGRPYPRIEVRLGYPDPNQVTCSAAVVWTARERDVALLRIEPKSRDRHLPNFAGPAIQWGVFRDVGLVFVTGSGYPIFAEYSGTARQVEQINGTVSPVSRGNGDGTFPISIRDAPDALRSGGKARPWQGFSGCAIFTDNPPGTRSVGYRRLLVGVALADDLDFERRLHVISVQEFLDDADFVRHLAADGVETPRPIPVHAHVDEHLGRPAPPRPTGAYRTYVYERLYVDDLPDRQDELNELREFCSGEEDYVWWQAAAWAGKSTLMARFMLDPGRDDVVTVGFFITASGQDQCDRFAFAAALVEQLCEVLGESPPNLRPDNADRQLLALLNRTAEYLRSQTPSRRLILVVDGLDEDRNKGSGPSIAELLPARPIPGLKVVVSSRPLPDVRAGHPLHRCQVRKLSRSERARSVEDAATAEVQQALQGGGGLAEDVLGLIAASGGGLSRDDLESLTDVSAVQLGKLLDGTLGRSLALRSVHQAATGAKPAQVYVFRHETLREKTEETIRAARMGTYREKVHSWALEEWAKGWSAASPAYLLYTYPYLLRAEGKLGMLLDLASDPGRQQRMLEVSHAAATAEVTMALDAVNQGLDQLEYSDATVLAVARLAAHRAELVRRAPTTPVNLPALWAVLGDVHHARALLDTVSGSDRKAKARQLVAQALAAHPQLEDEATRAVAEALAAHPQSEDKATRAVAKAPVPTPAATGHPVEELVLAGEVDKAVALVADTTDPQQHLVSIVVLVKALVRADEPWRAWELAGAQRVKDRFRLQATVVQEVARQGNVHLARRWAGKIKDPERKGRLWVQLIPDVCAAFGVAAASAIPKKIDPAHHKAMAQIEVARMAAVAGDLQRARAMAANAEETAARLTGTNRDQWLVTVHAGLVRAYSAMGELERAEAILARIDHPARAARALIEDVVPAASAAGDITRMEAALSVALAEQTSGDRQAARLVPLALAVAAHGDVLQARQMIEQIDDVALRRHALVELALRLAQADEAAAQQIAAAVDRPDEGVSDTHVQSRAVVQAALARERPDETDVPFADAESVARCVQDGYGQATSLSEVALALAEHQYWPRALAVAGSIDHPYYRATALLRLAKLLPSGDPRRAGALADAERAVGQVADPRWRATAAARLVQALTTHTEAAVLASHLAAGRRALRTEADPRERALALAELIVAASAAGRFGSVRAMAGEIDDIAERIPALLRAAAAAGRADHAERLVRWAESLLGKLNGPEQRVRVRARMVRSLAAMGRVGQARALVRRIPREVIAIIEPAVRGAAETDHVTAILACGDRSEAQRLARRIAHPYWQSQALGAVARSLVEHGELDEAEQVCMLVAEAERMTGALVHLAVAAAERGDVNRTERIAAMVSDPAQRAGMLSKLARIQPQGSTAARRLTVGALAAAPHWTDVLPAVVHAAPPTAHLVIGEHSSAGRCGDNGAGGQPPRPLGQAFVSFSRTYRYQR